MRAADVVEAGGDDVVDVLPGGVEEAELVHDAERPALTGSAVVGKDHEERVVEQAVSRKSTRRPICASVCSSMAANASCSRAAKAR